MSGGTGVQQTPWVWTAADAANNVIRITVTFNNATRALTGATVFRDAACVYTKIYIGVGSDGSPNSSPRVFTVPAGTTTFTAAQMSSVGLNTIENILAHQITAGP
jgi:hypothetical protein